MLYGWTGGLALVRIAFLCVMPLATIDQLGIALPCPVGRVRKSDDYSQTCASEPIASRQSVRDVRVMDSALRVAKG